MKASICFCFCFFFFFVVAPSCKDWGLGFFFFFVSFERVNELERKVWKKCFKLFFFCFWLPLLFVV
jgi:hypothetical protein